jgi:hypothetical protein
VARALPFLVGLSGAAALVYESLWMRSFGLIFGGTTSAVAMVLAVFMGGLAIGSALVARRPARDPLAAYGRIELAIGACALLTLPLLRGLPWAYGALVVVSGLTGAAEQLGIALLAGLVLLPSTVLLGATVPLAVEFLARTGTELHQGFGRLYLLNTLGGALGVALAPFVLVPALGVRGTLVAAAVTSLFVGGVARRWASEIGAVPPAHTNADESAAPPAAEPVLSPALGPALAFASGAATFGVEVLWTRSYALVIGSSVYAFNLMLLAVLLGIALGAVVYARVRARIDRPCRAVGRCFVGAGLAMLAGQWAIGRLPVVYLAALGVLPVSFTAHQLAAFTLCLATMLPVTLVLGISFPLLLHLARAGAAGAQMAAGRLYAWNTAGAIAGALATDLVLVKHLGLQPSYLIVAARRGGRVGARRREQVASRAAGRLGRGRGGGRLADGSRVEALGPRVDELRRAPLRARVGAQARCAKAPRGLAARAADAALLPGRHGGGGGGLGACRELALLPVDQRQDGRRQRRGGRRAAEVRGPRADAASFGPEARARDRMGVGRNRSLGRPLPARASRVRRDREGDVGGRALLRRAQRPAPGRPALPDPARPRPLRRDRLRAVERLDLRGLEPLHPRLPRGGALQARARRVVCAVVPLLQPRTGRREGGDRDLPLRLPARFAVARPARGPGSGRRPSGSRSRWPSSEPSGWSRTP